MWSATASPISARSTARCVLFVRTSGMRAQTSGMPARTSGTSTRRTGITWPTSGRRRWTGARDGSTSGTMTSMCGSAGSTRGRSILNLPPSQLDSADRSGPRRLAGRALTQPSPVDLTRSHNACCGPGFQIQENRATAGRASGCTNERPRLRRVAVRRRHGRAPGWKPRASYVRRSWSISESTSAGSAWQNADADRSDTRFRSALPVAGELLLVQLSLRFSCRSQSHFRVRISMIFLSIGGSPVGVGSG